MYKLNVKNVPVDGFWSVSVWVPPRQTARSRLPWRRLAVPGVGLRLCSGAGWLPCNYKLPMCQGDYVAFQCFRSDFARCDRRAMAVRLTPLLYVATLFVSALLLFSIQPMFAKMVLPMLGGAPSVWSVAMVFFQAALLAGYAYAHLLIRAAAAALGRDRSISRCSALRRDAADRASRPDGALRRGRVALWLFGLFAVSIGLPFLALSASAPLLQSWFAGSGHPQAANPYVSMPRPTSARSRRCSPIRSSSSRF